MSRVTLLRGSLAALVAMSLAGCDDQIKRVPIFSTMSIQPSVEAFEQPPRTPVPGTLPIDGEVAYGLLEADTMLVSPTSGSAAELARGEELYGQFCIVCHGPAGAGDGSVVGPNRIPDIPLLNLLTPQAAAYSDGYIWGMITNGRGVMPSYKRIPAQERWYVVDYVRQLQRNAGVLGNQNADEGAVAAGGDQ